MKSVFFSIMCLMLVGLNSSYAFNTIDPVENVKVETQDLHKMVEVEFSESLLEVEMVMAELSNAFLPTGADSWVDGCSYNSSTQICHYYIYNTDTGEEIDLGSKNCGTRGCPQK